MNKKINKITHVNSYRRGIWAEQLAALYLWFKGYRIRARRFKTDVGEIDLIATRGRTLIFVEVKLRQNLDDSLVAIRSGSYLRLQRAAALYVSRHHRFHDYAHRFDLVALGFQGGWLKIRHLDNIDLSGA